MTQHDLNREISGLVIKMKEIVQKNVSLIDPNKSEWFSEGHKTSLRQSEVSNSPEIAALVNAINILEGKVHLVQPELISDELKEQNAPKTIKLWSLKGKGSKVLVADESFWNNVDFIRFHSPFLEIKLMKGRPLYYLHDWLYKEVVSDDGYHDYAFDLPEGNRIKCTHRFPGSDDDFIKYLYDEATNRGVINYMVM